MPFLANPAVIGGIVSGVSSLIGAHKVASAGKAVGADMAAAATQSAALTAQAAREANGYASAAQGRSNARLALPARAAAPPPAVAPAGATPVPWSLGDTAGPPTSAAGAQGTVMLESPDGSSRRAVPAYLAGHYLSIVDPKTGKTARVVQ